LGKKKGRTILRKQYHLSRGRGGGRGGKKKGKKGKKPLPRRNEMRQGKKKGKKILSPGKKKTGEIS